MRESWMNLDGENRRGSVYIKAKSTPPGSMNCPLIRGELELRKFYDSGVVDARYHQISGEYDRFKASRSWPPQEEACDPCELLPSNACEEVEDLIDYISSGRMVTVEGKIHFSHYEETGETECLATDIIITSLHDLDIDRETIEKAKEISDYTTDRSNTIPGSDYPRHLP